MGILGGAVYYLTQQGGKGKSGKQGEDSKDSPKTFTGKAQNFWKKLDTPKKAALGAGMLLTGYAAYNKLYAGKTILGQDPEGTERDAGGSSGSSGGGDGKKSFWHKNGGWLVPVVICVIGVAVLVFSQMGGDPYESEYGYE